MAKSTVISVPSESSTASNTHPGSTYAEVNPSHRSRTSSMTSHPPQEAVPPEAPDLPIIDNRPLTRIQESRESSRPVTREHTTMSKERSDNKQQLEPHVVAKMAAAELERRCPAVSDAHRCPAVSGAHRCPAISDAHRCPAVSDAHRCPAVSDAHRCPAVSDAHRCPAVSDAHRCPAVSDAHRNQLDFSPK